MHGVGQPDFSDTTKATATAYVDEFYMIGAGRRTSCCSTSTASKSRVAGHGAGPQLHRRLDQLYSAKPIIGEVAGQASLTLGSNRLVRSTPSSTCPWAHGPFRASVATDYNQG